MDTVNLTLEQITDTAKPLPRKRPSVSTARGAPIWIGKLRNRLIIN